MESFAPEGGPGFAPKRNEVDYLAAMGDMMSAQTHKAAFGLRLGLWIVALAPLWLFGKLRTVTQVSLERRAEILDSLLDHRSYLVRELTLFLKLTACMGIFAVSGMRQRSGYDRRNDGYDDVQRSGERPRIRLDVIDEDAIDEGQVA